ncbi:helix-turn-helix domain-containing protein [Halobacterium wangiae]|uniref:helix-turn-helix domain-containing protein n=1 Tax=Halobacterium wangiae TaxID=2902623 RepID=UPI001E47FCDB|nr:helix-turn-helix domain-containing protein [Halobacterium wangiae]
MSIVAEFSLPPRAIPGGETLESLPAATVKLERLVPTGDAALPFFWVFDVDHQRFLEGLRDESGVSTVEVLTEVESSALFRAEWTPDAVAIQGIHEMRATVLDATGTADGWTFQVRAPSRDQLGAFRQLFTDRGVPVEIRRIYAFADLLSDDRLLTPEQRQTLIFAYQRGYFDEPRGVTQADLGEHFDISGRAVSNRLRRGTRNLVTSTLLDPTTRDDSNEPY